MMPSTTPDNALFFSKLSFKHPWRPEQKRVLAKLDAYLADKRIHIVAAPGAGKTVIGLEIFKRFQLKTLAISPTTVVRDQWMERLSDFLPDGDSTTHRCSRSITKLSLFTTTTYQGLYSFDKHLNKINKTKFTDDEQPHANDASQQHCLKAWFKHHDIKLLILDEAHHLKAAWWNVLMKLVDDEDDLIIVSLTATPPYDANVTEWSRYMKLCGPVDEEISIPELVRSRSLCPHQDYIWMVNTDEKNISSLNRQQEQLEKFITKLTNHHELLYLLQLHEWLDPQHPPKVKTVLYHLDECFALLSLLKQQHLALPDYLLTTLERKPEDIQAMDVFDWEVLLQSLIDGKHYPQAAPVKAFRETLGTLLRRKHFLKQTRVSLDNSAQKLQAFNKTQERIKGCFDIAKVEHANRQKWMRLVVLADYIRDEKYQLALDGLEAPTGCYPIFHYFIHHLESVLATKTALLTGRLSIIHKDLLGKFEEQLPNHLKVASTPYSENTDYVALTMPSHFLSSAFTALHKVGDLQILIGTRALLGEGWDAPHVNAMILATQTGAYVTSNQLRGRAIRIDPEDGLKTASIWHIIAVAPDMTHNDLIFQDLNRRFKTFAGIHASELQIESGIERLVFAEQEYAESAASTSSEISQTQANAFAQRTNELMKRRLEDDVYNLQARWQNALEKVEKHVFQLGLQADLSKSRHWNHLTYALTKERGLMAVLRSPLGAGTSAISFIACTWLAVSSGASPVMAGLSGVSGIGLALLLNRVATGSSLNEKSARASGIQLYESDPDSLKTIHIFAQIVLNALRNTDQIQTRHSDATETDEITVTILGSGAFRFSLNGFTRQENDIFLTGMSQLLEPIRQPRYVLVLTKKPQAHQIIPVPHVLGNNKNNAVAFSEQWNQHFSPKRNKATLHWTGTPEGQRYLLKARVAAHDDKEAMAINLIDRWE